MRLPRLTSKVFTGALIFGTIADCASGNKTASATTVCWIVVFSTAVTCTGTTGSFTPTFLGTSRERDRNPRLLDLLVHWIML
jgi:hypothetical protein